MAKPKQNSKEIEEMVNNTIALNRELGVNLLPFKCKRVSKVTIYPRVYFDKSE
jgi:hypothetical protein